jgi:hypothetical protein
MPDLDTVPGEMDRVVLARGSICVNAALTRPRRAEEHRVDRLSPLGSGACFGAAIVAAVATIRGRAQAGKWSAFINLS